MRLKPVYFFLFLIILSFVSWSRFHDRTFWQSFELQLFECDAAAKKKKKAKNAKLQRQKSRKRVKAKRTSKTKIKPKSGRKVAKKKKGNSPATGFYAPAPPGSLNAPMPPVGYGEGGGMEFELPDVYPAPPMDLIWSNETLEE